MKKLVFVFIVFSGFLIAQDQIILRSTSKAIWFELEIKKITPDSSTYLLNEKKAIPVTLAIKDIIAYRKGYENGPPYIFPNAEDREKYRIKRGRAIDLDMVSDLKSSVGEIDKEMLLRPHEVLEDYSESELVNNNKVVIMRKGSNRKVYKRKKAKIYIRLKEDSIAGYRCRIPIKKYKFTMDSMLFFKSKIKNETKFYSVRISDIKYIGIQTPGMIALKTLWSITLLPGPIPIYSAVLTMKGPMYRKFRLSKWEIKVS